MATPLGRHSSVEGHGEAFLLQRGPVGPGQLSSSVRPPERDETADSDASFGVRLTDTIEVRRVA